MERKCSCMRRQEGMGKLSVIFLVNSQVLIVEVYGLCLSERHLQSQTEKEKFCVESKVISHTWESVAL